MPDLVRWPQFRREYVSETEHKIYELVYVLDSGTVVNRGLQQFAIEAFSPVLTQSEARMLILLLVHKDMIQRKKRQTQSDGKSRTLRINNDWDLED